MAEHLIERLARLHGLSGIPRNELEWLVTHGRFGVHEAGKIIGPKGKRINHLWIILSGKIAVRVDRGIGPRLVTEWQSGDVSGMLPYSRMSGPPGDNYIEEKAELLAIDVNHFPEMIGKCPRFTAYTVHSMLDRARNFNTSDLQDEKMISLGKLSAGLAHELNNPASATVRNAKLLEGSLLQLNIAARALGALPLTQRQNKLIDETGAACLQKTGDRSMSPIQRADYQDKVSEWLQSRNLPADLEVPLADTFITIELLDKLAEILGEDSLEIPLKWLIASCHAQSLAGEIGHASIRIYKVVDAVKKFTYMDNLTEKTRADVVSSIQDTLDILIAKINSRKAEISLESAADLPAVHASGSDLNQIWFCLIDNALDAISDSGKINIKVSLEKERVKVRILDNGPGIEADIIAKIFDPFFTTKPAGLGTGLGLDIARRLLHRNHAEVAVRSRPGRTEFKVSLPIYTSAEAPARGKDESRNMKQ